MCDSLACGEHPLQGTDECPEPGHRPFQIDGVDVDALVLDGQGVRQVAILLLHRCKLQLGGLQAFADLSFCSHGLKSNMEPDCRPEPSYAVTASCSREL